jgi:hypothetical protein
MSTTDAPDGATPNGAATTKPGATPDTPSRGATPASDDDKGTTGDLGDPGVRALTAERERVKELERTNAEMRDRLAALEDAGKSEVERAHAQAKRESERAEEAERRVAELERGSARLRIAEEVGLPLELADRIQGDDDRAMRGDAKRLLELTAPADGRLGAGRGGVTPPRGAQDMNALIREASGRG